MVENPPSNAGVMGSIPGRGTNIPHAVRLKKKSECIIHLTDIENHMFILELEQNSQDFSRSPQQLRSVDLSLRKVNKVSGENSQGSI